MAWSFIFSEINRRIAKVHACLLNPSSEDFIIRSFQYMVYGKYAGYFTS